MNLFDLVPVRTAGWEEDDAGRVVIHAPRGRLLTFFAKLFGRGERVRIQLDEPGSFVWRRCEGDRTVADIVEEARRERGEDPEIFAHRTASFLRDLKKNRLIRFEEAP
ncbi:MAG: PqqD family protein [bacterium]